MGITHEFDTHQPWWSRWTSGRLRLVMTVTPFVIAAIVAGALFLVRALEEPSDYQAYASARLQTAPIPEPAASPLPASTDVVAEIEPVVSPPAGPGPPGSLLSARHDAALVRLADGSVLVTGGFLDTTEVMNTVERIDLTTLRSSPAPSMQHARGGHRLVQFPDGKLLVLGGFRVFRSANPETTIGSEMFDPQAGVWQPVADLDLLETPPSFPLILRADGDSLVGFEFTLREHREIPRSKQWRAWEWNRKTQRQTTLPQLASGREFFTALELEDGRLALIGGTTQRELVALEPDCATCAGEYVPYGPTDPSPTTDVFDFDTRRWSEGPKAGFAGGVAVRLRDGRVLKVTVADPATADARLVTEISDAQFTRWSRGSTLPLSIDFIPGLQCFELGARVAIFTWTMDLGNRAFLWSAETGALAEWPQASDWRDVAVLDERHVLVTHGANEYPMPRQFEILELP